MYWRALFLTAVILSTLFTSPIGSNVDVMITLALSINEEIDDRQPNFNFGSELEEEQVEIQKTIFFTSSIKYFQNTICSIAPLDCIIEIIIPPPEMI